MALRSVGMCSPKRRSRLERLLSIVCRFLLLASIDLWTTSCSLLKTERTVCHYVGGHIYFHDATASKTLALVLGLLVMSWIGWQEQMAVISIFITYWSNRRCFLKYRINFFFFLGAQFPYLIFPCSSLVRLHACWYWSICWPKVEIWCFRFSSSRCICSIRSVLAWLSAPVVWLMLEGRKGWCEYIFQFESNRKL